MDEDALTLFIDVARRLSFAAVAEDRNTDPSTISRSIAALESDLGVRLFHRTTRRMSLTEAGERFLGRATDIRDTITDAKDEARSAAFRPTGTLRVTASLAFGEFVIMPLMSEFQTLYPDIRLEFKFTNRRIDLLSESIDLAIRLSRPEQKDHIVSKLMPTHYRVIASPGFIDRSPDLHPANHPVPQDLDAHDCVRFLPPDMGPIWRFRGPSGETSDITVSGRMAFSSASCIRLAALDGNGPALLADWLVRRDLDSGDLVDLFPEFEIGATSLDNAAWIIHPSRSFVPAKVRAMVEFLRAKLARGQAMPQSLGG